MESYGRRSQKHGWTQLYEKAFSEVDDYKRLDLIAVARGAIFQRKQEIAHSPKAHAEELAALEDAAYVMAGLRRAAEFNRRR